MTVKYGHEFCGTWTREWRLWKRQEANVEVNYRPIPSSKRVPHNKKLAIVRKKTNDQMVVGSRWEPDTKADWRTDRWS
jgi:hypothetical protein